MIRATAGVLDNLRESYWLAARTVRAHVRENGIAMKHLQETYRKDYQASLLLGEVLKAEGGTVVLFGNALNRFAELGYVKFKTARRAGRERRVLPGPTAPSLDALEIGRASCRERVYVLV